MKTVLASKSPRRKEILKNLGFDFEVFSADADESSDITDAEQLVELLAERKGAAVKEHFPEDTLIISSDTIVAVDGVVLGKPASPENAKEMLRLLSGRKHTVSSGLSLTYGSRTVTSHENTDVYFSALPESFIESYVASGDPLDKAGAYAIQGAASMWIDKIDGCYFNVVGLPVRLLTKLLCKLGLEPTELINRS